MAYLTMTGVYPRHSRLKYTEILYTFFIYFSEVSDPNNPIKTLWRDAAGAAERSLMNVSDYRILQVIYLTLENTKLERQQMPVPTCFNLNTGNDPSGNRLPLSKSHLLSGNWFPDDHISGKGNLYFSLLKYLIPCGYFRINWIKTAIWLRWITKSMS